MNLNIFSELISNRILYFAISIICAGTNEIMTTGRNWETQHGTGKHVFVISKNQNTITTKRW